MKALNILRVIFLIFLKNIVNAEAALTILRYNGKKDVYIFMWMKRQENTCVTCRRNDYDFTLSVFNV